jgi:hypothetical protein
MILIVHFYLGSVIYVGFGIRLDILVWRVGMASKDDLLVILNALVLKVGELTAVIKEVRDSVKILEDRER